MLVKFRVSNYKSLSKEVEIDFVSANYPELLQNVFQHKRYNLLKSIAVYGANASGKSNLMNAFVFMRNFIINSSKESQSQEKIQYYPFKLKKGFNKKTTTYEVVILINDIEYRYGFEHNDIEVKREWLYEKSKLREVLLFKREFKNFDIRDKFQEGKLLEEKTRRNVLFISVVAQFNGNISNRIINWFQNTRTILGSRDTTYGYNTIKMLNDFNKKEKIKALMKFADFGINNIEEEKTPLDKSYINELGQLDGVFTKKFLKSALKEISLIKTFHYMYDDSNQKLNPISFDLNLEESDGTRKYFNIIGVVIEALTEGKLIVIDELEASLHPTLVNALLLLFNSNKANKKGAQLLFTTHETNLLNSNNIRRDQIYFTEKDHYESTNLYSLIKFKPRNDLSLEKNYLAGRFGAVPVIGDLESLFSTSSNRSKE